MPIVASKHWYEVDIYLKGLTSGCQVQVEFGLPDLESRAQIFQIHTRTMNCERDIRFELLARLCPNSTGADIRSVCTEAGMFAIRARRKTVTEKDFLESVNKVC